MKAWVHCSWLDAGPSWQTGFVEADWETCATEATQYLGSWLVLGCVQSLGAWEPFGSLVSRELQGLLEPVGSWIGQGPKFVGVHWKPPSTTRIGFLLGQAGTGIHSEMNLAVHFSRGRCLSPCRAASAWKRIDRVM